MTKQLLVVGGGAAGFFCAVNAARLNPALNVTLLEKSGKLLSKVKVSGGGRCNVTHACFDIDEMSKRYPRGRHFVKKSFHRFFTNDTIKWFEERGVKIKAEKDGRMFPVSDSSQSIIDCLLKEAKQFGVNIELNTDVRKIVLHDGKFQVHTGTAGIRNADYVMIATGGYPKAAMFDWLTETGHTIEPPVPSLFTFNLPANPITQLMGVAVEKAIVKIAGSKLSAEGPLLITHWGLSGPVILRLSAWGARDLAATDWQFSISVNWLPMHTEQEVRDQMGELRKHAAAQKVINRNPFGLPQRLWEFLIQQAGIAENTRWAELPVKEQNKLIKNSCAGEFAVKGKTTFKEEFVTSGGIRLNEVDANTMMSKRVPQLFFGGEVLDVDGITGGYNFQHAWTSGYIAASCIATHAGAPDPKSAGY